MTTVALHTPYVSQGSFKQTFQDFLKQAWTKFIEARTNRAMMLVSFYTVK